MRKLFALLLCLLLLPIMPARAAARAQAPLFRLTATDENGRETDVGSAVLVVDEQILFTSALVEDTAVLTAYAPDGSARAVEYILKDGQHTELVALILEEPVDLPVMGFSMEEAARSRLVGVTPNGLYYDAPAASVAETVYRGQEAFLVSAKERLLPGAVLVDSKGQLVGMTVAEWGEGEARYVALTDDALMEWLLAALLGEPEETKAENPQVGGRTTWLLDAELHYWDGTLVVDWRDSQIQGLNSMSVITVYVECPANSYYLYYTADPSDGAMFLDAAPGYAYNVWVSHTYGTLDYGRTAENALSITIPEQGDFTDFDFTNECYLAWAPAEETPDVSERLPALETITAETLENEANRLYLQAINTYAVEEELETSLVIVLQTPEGYVFHSLSGYIFMPEIQAEDVWNAEVTPLFRRYQLYNGGSSYAPGEYRLSYLIGGRWAGSVTFTLE